MDIADIIKIKIVKRSKERKSTNDVDMTEQQYKMYEKLKLSVEWMIEPTDPFSYNNTQSLSTCPPLVQVQKSSIQQGYHVAVIHYLGMCQYCFEEPSDVVSLKRCSKCPIVAYCSKECQIRDWKSHKAWCKIFPLRIGIDDLNGLSGKVHAGSQEELINELTKRSHKMVLYTIDKTMIGLNQVSRRCHYPDCTVYQTSQLYCCKCLEVCYCSQSHQDGDSKHWEVCNKSYIKMDSYQRNNSTLSIPYMSAYPASSNYMPLRGGKNEVSTNIISEITEAVVTEDIANDKWTKTQVEILSNRLSMPFTILYCLQKFGVGHLSTPLAEVTILNIHIITSMPLFDPQMWELLLHRLPALKELNITYVNRAGLNWHPNNVLNTMIKLERCEECEKNDRVVSIKVLLSRYHMYFSSDDYVEPDVVAFFGYNKKLLDADCSLGVDDDDVNEVTSLRNMSHSKNTLLIVTDHEKCWVENAITEINHARPINRLMPSIIINPVKAEGHIDNMRIHGHRFNILRYITCLQRK